MIYVLADTERTTVKIGFSGRPDPVKRCEDLEQNHPKQLVLLLLLHGDRSDERWLHKRFAAWRMPDRREWFKFGTELEGWLRSEVGIITQPFYTWLLERRNDLNPIGALAGEVAQVTDFPHDAKSFFVIEHYLGERALAPAVVFEQAWRAFLRSAARKVHEKKPLVPKPEIKPERVRPSQDRTIAQIMSGAVEIAKSRGFLFLTHREIGAHLKGGQMLAYSLALAFAVAAGPARAQSLCATVVQTTGALIVLRQPTAYAPALVRDAHDVAKLMLEL